MSLVLAGELSLSRVRTISAQNMSPRSDADFRGNKSSISELSVPFPLVPDIPSNLETRSRTAFICQEFARTECHYLSSLRVLLNTGSAEPLFSVYLPPLVEVSEKLLTALEQDLSAGGVAMSFLSLETKIQTSFTSWCGAFGCLFRDDKKRSRVDNDPELPRRRADSWGLKTIKCLKAWKVPAMDLCRREPQCRSRPTSHILTSVTVTTRASLRDLAILPIQRVTNYKGFFEGDYCHLFQTACTDLLKISIRV